MLWQELAPMSYPTEIMPCEKQPHNFNAGKIQGNSVATSFLGLRWNSAAGCRSVIAV